jgi:nucleotide-binding universal stress UspA family protein
MKSIIVTTDFSETASNAALYAADIGVALGAESIILYHSYHQAPTAIEIPIPEINYSIAHKRSLFELEFIKEYIHKRIGDKLTIKLIADEHPLIYSVDKLSKEWQASLVVAGATGKSSIEKFIVGSNTASLASSSLLPLLIVPNNAKFKPISKVVFACDLRKVDLSTPVDTLQFYCDKLHAKLLILNVEMKGKHFDPDTIPEQYKLHHLLDQLNPEYHYTEENEEIVKGIIHFAEEKDAGLVITVPRHHGFFESIFHSSVTNKLVNRTKIPLLVLRQKRVD